MWDVLAGAAISLIGGRKAAKSQDQANRAAIEASQRADQLSREQFDWNRSIYERDVAPAQRENQRLQREIADESLASSRQQRDFATRQRQEYESTFLPNERRVVADAAGYDSDANVSRRAGMAAANVNQQFANASGQRSRLLTRFGLNPNSSAFARQAAGDARAQAAASAGAQTGAAFDTMDRAIALRAGAANLGRGLPATAANFFGGANSSASTAGNASGAAAGAINPALMNSAYGARTNAIIDVGGIQSRALQNQANAWGGVAQGLGNMTGQLINNAGGWGNIWSGIKSGFGFGGSSPASWGSEGLGMPTG